MGQISSDFLELNNGELPLQPLPRKIVQKLNDGASHEHLRLVLAKICAQIPAAAKVAESNLCMPVSYYDNRKVATFLGIQYDPAIEDLPDNVCTTLEQAYSRAADPSVIASVKAATASASETQVSVPQSQAPTSQQGPGLHQAPAAPATQTSQAPQVPQAQAYPPSNQTLPPQTQMLAPQIALQAQQYGLQFQNPKQYQSAPAAPRPVISVPQGHASAYQAGLAAAAMGQPSATQNKPLATQAISTTSKVEAPAKRKAEEGNKSRLPTCTTCNKSFNPDKNGPASCTYHTGMPLYPLT